MNWQILVIISVLASSVLVILQRVLLRHQKTDPIAFVLFTQLINSAVMLIVALVVGFKLPDLSLLWFPILLTFVLYGGGHILYANTLKRVEASVFSTLLATSTVWVMVMGAIVFHEHINILQIMGAVLIFVSIGLLVERTSKLKPKLEKSVVMGLLMGVVFGVASAAWVYVGKQSDAVTWIALSALGPGLVVLLLRPKSVLKMRPLLTKSVLSKMLVLAASFGIANLAMLAAYKRGSITLIAPLLQTSIIVTVLIGIAFLGERTKLWHKLAAAVVCFVGVLIITVHL